MNTRQRTREMKVEIKIMCKQVNGLNTEMRSVVDSQFLPAVMLEGQLSIKDQGGKAS